MKWAKVVVKRQAFCFFNFRHFRSLYTSNLFAAPPRYVLLTFTFFQELFHPRTGLKHTSHARWEAAGLYLHSSLQNRLPVKNLRRLQIQLLQNNGKLVSDFNWYINVTKHLAEVFPIICKIWAKAIIYLKINNLNFLRARYVYFSRHMFVWKISCF